jgi:hypothetical protein
LEEQNPTAGDSGASTLDRIESYLSGTQPQSQPVKQEPQAQTDPAEPEVVESVEPDDGGKEQADEPQLSTSDLAKLLKLEDGALDLDEEGNPVFKTKVDGKEGAAKLQDLLKSYQLQEHVDRRTREAAAREQALQARSQEVEQQFQQKLAHADQLTTLAQQELMAEFQSIDWKALDQHPDQGAVAALKLKFQERSAKIQQAQQGINAHRWQLNQQAQAQQQVRIQAEAAKLPELIPEWRDQAVAAKESAELIDWGRKSGYSDEELKALSNSSALHVATVRKAMLFDKQQKLRPAIEAQVRTAPKLVKPGQPAQNTQGQKLQSIKQSVIKSGGKRGIAEYLLAAGKV